MAKILLIDDDDNFRDMLTTMLERTGYEVLSAYDGKAGIESFVANQPDLVITDLIMPTMNGIDAISELHRKCPTVKIIAISGGGFGNADSYLEGTKKLFNLKHTFMKPLNMKDFLSSIENLLQA